MAQHHKKNEDGSWTTYTDEEWNRLNPPDGPLMRAFKLGAIVGLVVSLFAVYVFSDLNRLNNPSEFGWLVLFPTVVSGLVGVFLVSKRLSEGNQRAAEQRSKKQNQVREEMAEIESQRKKARQRKLEQEIQEAEEKRAEAELREKAAALQKEGRSEEAAEILKEVSARSLEKLSRMREAREAERKQREADEIAKKKAELERLKNATDHDDGRPGGRWQPRIK